MWKKKLINLIWVIGLNMFQLHIKLQVFKFSPYKKLFTFIPSLHLIELF